MAHLTGPDNGYPEIGKSERFRVNGGKRKYAIKKAEDARETEAIGLPVDSLRKEFSDEVSDKVKKDRLLAEEFENELGIVDTMGNILEWTSNNFTALSNNKNRSGQHVAKGGSWISKNDITLFSRFKIAPGSHSNILGFRCVAH